MNTKIESAIRNIKEQVSSLVLGWTKTAQLAFTFVVRRWIEGKEGKRAQFSTDGENIYYYNSHVVTWIDKPNIFAINNQGFRTETTVRIFNNLLHEMGFNYTIYRRAGEMMIQIDDKEYLFPANKWVEFDRRNKKILTPLQTMEEKEFIPPTKVLKEIMDQLLTKIRLLKDRPEDIFDITIPGTKLKLEDLYADIYSRRYIYKSVPDEEWFTSPLTSSVIDDDIRAVIREKFQTGEWDAQEIAKELGLTR